MVSGAGVLLDPRYQKILKREITVNLKKKSNQKPKTNTQLISVYKSQLKEMETKNKQTKNSTKKKEEEKRTQAQTHLLKLKSNRKK